VVFLSVRLRKGIYERNVCVKRDVLCAGIGGNTQCLKERSLVFKLGKRINDFFPALAKSAPYQRKEILLTRIVKDAFD